MLIRGGGVPRVSGHLRGIGLRGGWRAVWRLGDAWRRRYVKHFYRELYRRSLDSPLPSHLLRILDTPHSNPFSYPLPHLFPFEIEQQQRARHKTLVGLAKFDDSRALGQDIYFSTPLPITPLSSLADPTKYTTYLRYLSTTRVPVLLRAAVVVDTAEVQLVHYLLFQRKEHSWAPPISVMRGRELVSSRRHTFLLLPWSEGLSKNFFFLVGGAAFYSISRGGGHTADEKEEESLSLTPSFLSSSSSSLHCSTPLTNSGRGRGRQGGGGGGK